MTALSKVDLELAYLYFDMTVSRSTGLDLVLPSPGRFTRLLCAVGLHQWGFTACRACGKPDKVLRSAIADELTPERVVELKARLFAGTASPEA